MAQLHHHIIFTLGLVATLLSQSLPCHSVRLVRVDTTASPTACDGTEYSGISFVYPNGTCLTKSTTSSSLLTCYPDGSIQWFDFTGSGNCTNNANVIYNTGNLTSTATSQNRCMPVYRMDGQYQYSLIVACDGTGTPATVSPGSLYYKGSNKPLTSDTNITNVEYYTTADCSGIVRSNLSVIPNGGCINDPLGPGTAQRLSCRYDVDKGNFQYVEVWAGQASLSVPNNCPSSTINFDNGNMDGYRNTNYGDCITLYATDIPYGSYKFTCPSMAPIPVSSSSSSSSSSTGSTPSSSSSSSTSSSSSSTIGSTAVGSSSTGSTTSDSSSTGSNASYGFIQYHFSAVLIGVLILAVIILV